MIKTFDVIEFDKWYSEWRNGASPRITEEEIARAAFLSGWHKINRTQSARIEALERVLGDARDALVDAQGEWSCVDIAYCPESIQPLREAENEIDALLARNAEGE